MKTLSALGMIIEFYDTRTNLHSYYVTSIDVALVQETKLKPMQNFHVPNYHTYRTNRLHSREVEQRYSSDLVSGTGQDIYKTS